MLGWRAASLALLALAGAFGAGPTAKAPVTRLKIPVIVPSEVSFGAQQVKAAVDGVPATVVGFSTPADHLLLLLVLDLSGDLSLVQPAKAAIMSELEQLPPHVHVALLRAQDGLRVIQDPTADRTVIQSAVEALSVSGRAGFLDSAETAAAIADSILAKSSVRVAIFYISDSDVTNYREDFTNPVINSSDAGDLSRKFPEALVQEKISKVDANLARTQVPLFLVQISYRSDRLNQAYLNGLRRLSLTTGGIALVCRSNAEIPAAIKNVFETIRNHYSITVEVPKVQSRSVNVRLGIADPDGGQIGVLHRLRFGFKKE